MLWTLQCGVLQGLILSPILFNIYMKPLSGIIQSFGVSCQQYANDTQLYFSSTFAGVAMYVLDCCLALVMDWIRANKRKLNPDKTEALLVGLFPRPDESEVACS
ncbi:Hypothetical predicted protein [Podarcis lilfordi]|uniref:Reverse transcriptase domain-containing protein n=1 Tax=Podarcis lilfordi TaxID=74358 RepID=A0AA35JWV3_9SAUR|nr:Hypothetical predicted protein [Podarcis lilfordi]